MVVDLALGCADDGGWDCGWDLDLDLVGVGKYRLQSRDDENVSTGEIRLQITYEQSQVRWP